MFTLVCCNFSKSQGGKIQTLLELSYHSHLKKEGMTAAIAGHRRRGGRSKPYKPYESSLIVADHNDKRFGVTLVLRHFFRGEFRKNILKINSYST